MMATVEQLENRLNALIAQLTPQQRRGLARIIGMRLAKSQRARIAKNQNPDGTAYAPRKPQRIKQKLKQKKRGKMFQKLKTAKFLKAEIQGDVINVGFDFSASKIANIHQYGLRGRVIKNIWTRYEKRELLGFSNEDIEIIENLIIEAIETHL